ncbi:MAG: redoxin domain-containing protein [Planctomycetes bacterium]|nr:redoxin domain-containing protein [Planctomycetota bacterium]
MSRTSLRLLGALALAIPLFAQEPAAAPRPSKQPPAFWPSLLRFHCGDTLPEVKAVRGDGTEWRLSEHRGRPTVVAMVPFAARGDAPALLPELGALQERFARYGVQTVAVVNWARPEQWSAWAKEQAAKASVLVVCDPVAPLEGDVDQETRLAHHGKTLLGTMFGGGMTPPLPALFLVDAQGCIVGSFRLLPEEAKRYVGLAQLLRKAGVQLEAQDLPGEAPPAEFWVKKEKVVEKPVDPIADGTVAKDFVMKDATGKEVRLADHAGKVVVLDFWATWCGPCKAALPHLQEVAKQWKEHGVVVIASCTNDGREEFEEFVAEQGAKYPDVLFVHDPKERAEDRASRTLFGVGGIPHQFVIGRDGKIAAQVVGYRKGEVLLEAALHKAGVPIDAATLEKAAADQKLRDTPSPEAGPKKAAKMGGAGG